MRQLTQHMWLLNIRDTANSVFSKAVERFVALTNDLHDSKFSSSHLDEVSKIVLQYNEEDFTTSCASESLPWWIVSFLARTLPKYVYLGRASTPDATALRIKNFLNEVKWHHVLREDTFPPPFRMEKAQFTPYCLEKIDTPVECWTEALFDTFMSKYTDFYKRLGSFADNRTPNIVFWVLKLMKQYLIFNVRSDKDDGFVIVPIASLNSIEKKNSKAAKNVFSKVTLSRDVRLAKLDVKDFFLSGTLGELSRVIHSAMHGHLFLNLVAVAVEFLLHNQYVRSRSAPCAVDAGAYRVLKGSGMSPSHSGEIASLAFNELVEVSMSSDASAAPCGLVSYLRFNDDILAIVQPDNVNEWIDTVTRRAKFFIVVEVISYYVVFLNLKVAYNVFRVVTFHYTKPSAMLEPSSCFSGQAPAVHNTWLLSMASTIKSLCTRPKEATRALDKLTYRFCAATIPIRWPTNIHSPAMPRLFPRHNSRGTLWLPLPYHLGTATHSKAFVRVHVATDECFQTYQRQSRVYRNNVAWMNGSPPVCFRNRCVNTLSEGGRTGIAEDVRARF